jgi:ankyrin repeat protein
MLLKWGANVRASNQSVDTPLHQAVIIGGGEADARRISRLAGRHGVGSWMSSKACVHYCRFSESHDLIVDLLLVAGADIAATNNDGMSPLS